MACIILFCCVHHLFGVAIGIVIIQFSSQELDEAAVFESGMVLHLARLLPAGLHLYQCLSGIAYTIVWCTLCNNNVWPCK